MARLPLVVLIDGMHAGGEPVASNGATPTQSLQITLAWDVHAASIVVVRMVDGAKPQPPQ